MGNQLKVGDIVEVPLYSGSIGVVVGVGAPGPTDIAVRWIVACEGSMFYTHGYGDMLFYGGGIELLKKLCEVNND